MLSNRLKFSFLFSSILLFCACKTEVTKKIKPNIIFLLTDDQRWDAMGVMGNSEIKTPNLDALANEGMLFKNAYVTTSICCVSRSSILTGQYESRHGINDFTTSMTESALEKTYPYILKASGYEIGFIGKYGVGNPKDQPKHIFDYWKGINKHQPNYENIDEKGDTIHYTDIVEKDIITFLDLPKTKPFCLSVSFKAPHSEDGDARQFIPKSKYKNYYKDILIPQPETAKPQFWDSLPHFFKSDENIARQRWKLRFDTPEKYQEMVKNYYRLINGVDDVVGDLRKLLKEKNLDKNTIIIFMGDNGMYLGEHGLAGKWFGHEESIRVPLIIYDPRTASNPPKTIDDIALNIDIAPTILQLAGVNKTEDMQGLDLLNKKELKRKNRNSFFYEHTFQGSPKLPKIEGVVSTSIKYLNYVEYNYEELYDLKKDPHETSNIINNPEYAVELDSLRSAYKQLKEQVK
jgi:arylsulfatase A-like enzyme